MNEKNLGSDVPQVNKLETAMNGLKNVTDLSVLKSVPARVRQRMRELKELSSAKHEKVQMGHLKRWVTTPPKQHIAGLDASISNNVGVITYSVYAVDKKGNKKMDEHIVERTTEDGRTIRTNASSNYILEKQVVETIAHRKPIMVEEFKEDN